MTAEANFVQACEGPVFTGSGSGTLACSCGQALIEGYDPARFLGVAIQCGQCAAVTVTPGLPAEIAPPAAAVLAETVAEVRTATTAIPPNVYVVGRIEYDRIAALYQPHTPADNVYPISALLLDEVAATYESMLGVPLPDSSIAKADDPFAGSSEHALGWAVAHLRGRLRAESWASRESEASSAAGTNVAAFLHFVRTWSHHPLFPAMAATAAERGFSLHGLAPFAAAHCLTMQGNRIGFPTPAAVPGRIGHIYVAAGPSDMVTVLPEVFDRFEYPYGAAWNAPGLLAAVSEVVLRSQARINLKNPGILLLSPGVALGGYDEALIVAVKTAVQSAGRKNRGLMGVTLIVLRMRDTPDPHSVRFGYGLFPIVNRHYRGETLVAPPE
nr:hypothetical protein [uncultured Rhodopila sp.]